MGKTTGFLDYPRLEGPIVSPGDRAGTFSEFHACLPPDQQQLQGGRCMACGVPFCQAGTTIEGAESGCPLHNLIPETNDLVWRGRWDQAYRRLSVTSSFPEFTSRVCPALCEMACTCSLGGESVSTRENERAIIEHAFARGLVEEPVPPVRTGKRVAVIGSGPAGLACALLLNRRGHSVTVFERADRPGGLLRYGIPNMKLDKRLIDRRIRLMEGAGIEFRTGVDVGVDVAGRDLLDRYDRVVLCCGASRPRDLDLPGRDGDGICFAVPFLSEVTKKLMDLEYDDRALTEAEDFSFRSLRGKNVVVIGGGDTACDCVATCVRLGAGSVTQLIRKPMPPLSRPSSNPWPEQPRVLKTGYGQEEALAVYGADPRLWQTRPTEFLRDSEGHLRAVRVVQAGPEEAEREIPADFVLIAAGFSGPEAYIPEAFGVECDEKGQIKMPSGSYRAGADRVFAAGDMRLGPTLVVRAIAEGQGAARAVDESLMGYSNL